MFSLRHRFGIPGVIAVVALVFAMVGGAYAAKGVIITKLNQISPQVQKQLKGKAGPAGAVGPAGAPGAKGDTGAAGAPGKDGGVGSQGLEGPEGPEGEAGPEGSPWVAGEAPSGVTLKGTWVLPPASATAPSEAFYTAVSTGVPIPLLSAAEGGLFVVDAPAPTFCPDGTADNPQPGLPGILCVFVGEKTNLNGVSNGFSKLKLSHGGTVLAFTAEAAGPVSGYGSWALKTP